MQDLTKLINDIQRSPTIDEEGKITSQAAVQHYYKYMASVNYIKQDEAKVATANTGNMEKWVFKKLEKFTKPELAELGGLLSIPFKEEDTKADMIKSIREGK